MCPNCGGYKVEHKWRFVTFFLSVLTFGLYYVFIFLPRWFIKQDKTFVCQICGYEFQQ
jgi:hypothetical protein